MVQTPKKKQKKKAADLTTDEAMKKLFSKKVVTELKKVTGKTPEKKGK